MLQYLLLFWEFIYIKRSKLIFSVLLSAIIGISVSCGNLNLTEEDINTYISNSTNVLGILLGFTASIFAIIITNGNTEIEEAKKKETKIKLYKKPFTIYDQLVIGCGFLIFLFGFLLILNFLMPIYKNVLQAHYLKLFSANIALIIFSVIQLVSSILQFYFIITKRND